MEGDITRPKVVAVTSAVASITAAITLLSAFEISFSNAGGAGDGWLILLLFVAELGAIYWYERGKSKGDAILMLTILTTALIGTFIVTFRALEGDYFVGTSIASMAHYLTSFLVGLCIQPWQRWQRSIRHEPQRQNRQSLAPNPGTSTLEGMP